MTSKEKVYILIILLGLIAGMIVMYLTISSTIYKIKNNTEQIIKDHRTMTCTIITLDNGNNAIVCYPQELDLPKDEIPHVNI